MTIIIIVKTFVKKNRWRDRGQIFPLDISDISHHYLPFKSLINASCQIGISLKDLYIFYLFLYLEPIANP